MESLYKDGSLIAGPVAFLTPGVTSATNSTGAFVGSDSVGVTGLWLGDIAEIFVIVGATALSTPRVTQLNAYLKAKWATP